MGSGSSKEHSEDLIRRGRSREIEETLLSTRRVEPIRNHRGPSGTRTSPIRSSNNNNSTVAAEDSEVFSFAVTPERKVTKLAVSTLSGAKSAPVPGNAKMKDPEVDEAIAELEETFRSLEMHQNSNLVIPTNLKRSEKEENLSVTNKTKISHNRSDSGLSNSDSCSTVSSQNNGIGFQDSSNSVSPQFTNSSSFPLVTTPVGYSLECPQSGPQRSTGTPLGIGYYNNGHPTGTRTSIHPKRTRSQHGTSTNNNQLHIYQNQHYNQYNNQAGHPLKRLHPSGGIPARSSSQILVIQQQKRRPDLVVVSGNSAPAQRTDSQEWIYQPPKIEGFDIEKFKEVNRKDSGPPISISLRIPSEDSVIPTLKKDYPAYTKDELELIASLEREIF